MLNHATVDLIVVYVKRVAVLHDRSDRVVEVTAADGDLVIFDARINHIVVSNCDAVT